MAAKHALSAEAFASECLSYDGGQPWQGYHHSKGDSEKTMKKLKFAIATLIIIPLVIAASHIYLRNVTEDMVTKINQAEQSERDSKTYQTKTELDGFSNEWSKNELVLATFIRHSELDIANQSIAKLKSLADTDDVSGFYAECETLKMQIRHLVEVERFSPDNIL
jgi:hypothetical protein